MYQLQILTNDTWENCNYPPTQWSQVARRRLSYYETEFPNETYRLAFIMKPETIYA